MTTASDGAADAAAAALLDAPGTYEARDPRGYARLLDGLPAQSREAWALASSWTLPPDFADFGPPSRVLLLGMGGSAIGADVVAAVARQRGRIPVEVVREYEAPEIDDRALVIACSFSGNTEETLAAFEGTLGRPGMRLAVTTGGQLAADARTRGTPLITYAWDGPPRTALGFGVFTALGLLARLGVIAIGEDEVDTAIAALEDAVARYGTAVPANDAKRLAVSIGARVPVILGPGFLEVAARRFATEVNENAKQWAFYAPLPEFNHNALQGLAGPTGTPANLAPIFLDAATVHPRNRKRVQETARSMSEHGASPQVIEIDGASPLETILRAMSLATWTSYYLAMLHEVDPEPVPTIEAFKQRLVG